MALMTVAEFCRKYHFGQATVRRLIATDPVFPAKNVADDGQRPRYRIYTSGLPAWIASGREVPFDAGTAKEK